MRSMPPLATCVTCTSAFDCVLLPAPLSCAVPHTGDEPLYTQEVGCVSAPVFTAHARHMVVLQPGETVADCFAATSGSNNGSEPGSASAAPDHLQFEVRGLPGSSSSRLACLQLTLLHSWQEATDGIYSAHASATRAWWPGRLRLVVVVLVVAGRRQSKLL